MDEPKFEGELQAVKFAAETHETTHLNWYNGSEGWYWEINGYRGQRCSGVAYADGSFTRLVQDPYARVSHPQI